MRYQDAVLLRRGSTGEIYKAYDPVLDRFVALKFLRRDDPVHLERMLHEARAQARIDHEGICKVYEIGERDGRPFLALQFIDGDELGKLSWRLTLEQKVWVMKQVAEALHAAHQRGLIHRDLKPANIMLEPGQDGSWRPCVIDFGLVQEVQAGGLSGHGEVLGTPSYMAPEQARGETRRLDRRTDVYSLGATLYELLVGRAPFTGGSPLEIVLRSLHDEPTPPHKIDPTIPVDLETILLCCLEKNPERRYPSARALAEDLDAYLQSKAVRARPPSALLRIGRLVRKHRATLGLGTATSMMVVALVSGSLWQRLESRKQNQLVRAFASEGKDIEWMMRAESMSPRHDIAPFKSRARERIQRLRRALRPEAADGTPVALLVVGQARLALGDDRAARDDLEKAWESGYRSPEAAAALGLALALADERAMLRADDIRDEDLRAARRSQIEAEIAIPAVHFLQEGLRSPTTPRDYVESRIALCQRRYADARAAAERSLRTQPWRFEARLVAARSLMFEANDRRNEGREAEAALLDRQAEVAFQDAILAAPSAPRAYLGLCQVRSQRFALAARRGEFGERESLLTSVETACRDAASVDAELAAAHVARAQAHQLMAASESAAGRNPEPDLERSIEAAQAALDADAQAIDAWILLAHGRLEQARGAPAADPLASSRLLEAGNGFRRALAIDPREVLAWNGLGGVHLELATRALRAGVAADVDPGEAAEDAIEALEKAAELAPSVYGPLANLAVARRAATLAALRAGEPFRAKAAASAEAARRALAVRPGDPWMQAALASAQHDLALSALLSGGDPTTELSEATSSADAALATVPTSNRTSSGWPASRWPRRVRAEIELLAGRWDLERGLDAQPRARSARQRLGRPGTGSDPLTVLVRLDADLLGSRAARAAGAPPGPWIERAERDLADLQGEGTPFELRLARARVDLERTEWARASGRSLDAPLASLRDATASLLRGPPPDPEALAIAGAGQWLEATASADALRKRDLALLAADRLLAAFSRNGWLIPRYGPYYLQATEAAGAAAQPPDLPPP